MVNMKEKLKEIGLTEYEAKAYLTLLQFGTQTGKEVAEKSGIPPTRVFDVLRSLANKGLVSLLQGRPLLFKPIEPEVGIKNIVERRLERLKKLERDILSLTKTIRKKEAKAEIHEKVTVILGFEKMFDHVTELINKASKRVLIFSIGEEIPWKVKLAIKNAVKRGLDTRFIASKCDEENKHVLKEFKKLGWKMKHFLTSQEYSFGVYDDTAVINIKNPKMKEERITVIFEVKGLARALRDYFEQLWKKAKLIKF